VARVLIIGSGLTGLSTAYHLEKQGCFDYLLVERETTVGGLCRSIEQDGYTFDYTGHLLHASDPYFQSFFSNVVGVEHMNTIIRRSYIYSHNTYTRYPFQVNLYGLPPEVIADCIEGYICRKQSKKEPKNFKQWVLQNFGKGVAEHFFYGYQKKIYSYDLEKLTTSWMGRFVPSTDLRKLIIGATQQEPDETIGYNAHFWYPKQGGIQFWIQKLFQSIQKPINTNTNVTQINVAKKYVTFDDGSTEPYDILISTIPLDILLSIITETSATTFTRARKNLLCNSVVNINLGIKDKNVSDKHWVYFPEETFPFYRIGFYHNFSEHMAPVGCSSLYAEFSFLHASENTIAHKIEQSRAALYRLLDFNQEDVATEKILKIDRAYVIYNAWRDTHLPKLLQALEQQNIYSIGRYGGWKYSSMQESILDGRKIVDDILVRAQPEKKIDYYPDQPHYQRASL
jgi:protoporphyrinogen oxidase